MKVAARFPVKAYPLLIGLIAFLHWLLLLVAYNEFGFSWLLGLVIASLCFSLYLSIVQYRKITLSPDDLCWSGESWLMHSGVKLNAAFYFELQPSSWVSRNLSLLHFTCGARQYRWLFSRAELGERLYSELIYLVNQDLKSGKT